MRHRETVQNLRKGRQNSPGSKSLSLKLLSVRKSGWQPFRRKKSEAQWNMSSPKTSRRGSQFDLQNLVSFTFPKIAFHFNPSNSSKSLLKLYGKYLNQMNDPHRSSEESWLSKMSPSVWSATAPWTTAHKAAEAARQARVGDRNTGFMIIGQTTLCPQPASVQTPCKYPQSLIFV